MGVEYIDGWKWTPEGWIRVVLWAEGDPPMLTKHQSDYLGKLVRLKRRRKDAALRREQRDMARKIELAAMLQNAADEYGKTEEFVRFRARAVFEWFSRNHPQEAAEMNRRSRNWWNGLVDEEGYATPAVLARAASIQRTPQK